ncbi:MAG: proteasome assembly chaperone family protein [Candidatus Micrarchaeota archaeon]
MKETTIIEREAVKLRDGVLITGLPGIGLIGQVVGRYLVKELKARKIATLLSPHFPHQVFMTKKGGMRIIRNSFYVVKRKKANLLILVGDVQAMSSVGQYEVADTILDYAQKVGVNTVMTVGGYSTGKLREKRRLFAVATSDEIRKKFSKYGVIFGKAKGSIVGAAGLLPVLGRLKGLDGICLMGETHGGYVDPLSAREIVKLLSTYFEFEVSLRKLDERAKESEKLLKRMEEEIQKGMPQATLPTEGVSYIR